MKTDSGNTEFVAVSRQEWLTQSTPIVVKVGTNVLADDQGRLDRHRIQNLADQLHRLRAPGRDVVLVSSGAIGAGVGRLHLGKRPTDLPHLQACAAVGQTALMQLYQEALTPHGMIAAQILLTAGDFESRPRYLNVRNTIRTLFEYSCLPIINENDTVSVAEIKFGDNDHLAALVCHLLQAPLLVLLTNVDGLFDADPRTDPTAQLQLDVPRIDPSITGLAGTTKSQLGTGGMKSKLRAAHLATAAGAGVIMANGSTDGVLDRIFRGDAIGTFFHPQPNARPAWKRWLSYNTRPKGTLIIDAGATRAVQEKGRSLLAVGIVGVAGEFGKGDVVKLQDPHGTEIARGLSNYSSVEIGRMAGHTTESITAQFGKVSYDEVIHRDHLVLVDRLS
ncbi:MAG: glutamate 5-kinase [Gemmataceae bacterium]